jgi:polyisoprenyl-teichoic acid--peptidoglycan teichoic acid transferase
MARSFHTSPPKKPPVLPASYPTRVRPTRERGVLRRPAPGRSVATQRRSGGCGTLVVGLLVVLVLVLTVSAFVVNRFTRATEQMESADVRPEKPVAPAAVDEATPIPAVLPERLKTPFTVLLLGVDKRSNEEGGARSDTLIVLRVDPQEQWAAMLSIPRDSVVTIPNVNRTKINSAYTYGYMHAESLYGAGTTPAQGGGALAAETVEEFLDVRVDYIAQIDFHGFEQVIDTLGGITVNVRQPLLDAEYPTEYFGYERIYIPAGLQVLDGRTALQYARSRHSGSDFDRSRRQQQVLRAMLQEVQRRGFLDQVELLPKVFENLQENITTTLPVGKVEVLYGLSQLANSIPPDHIVRLSINPNDVRIVQESGSDIYWNQNDIALLVERLYAGPSAEGEVARIQVQNGAGEAGLATRYTNLLKQQGFFLGEASDAADIYQHTVVIDYTGLPQTRQRLADLMGIEAHYVYAEPTATSPPAPVGVDILVILGADYQQHPVSVR